MLTHVCCFQYLTFHYPCTYALSQLFMYHLYEDKRVEIAIPLTTEHHEVSEFIQKFAHD